MNEIITINNIEKMIYEIRGVQVMLDSDLAKLYQCTNGTKDINKAVKRNIERFPIDFYFQLTKEEYDNLKFQIGTSSLNNYGGVRKLPYVFTEQGVAMLATVLRTSISVNVSVAIMRTFVSMRKYISNNLVEQKYINNQVMKNVELIEKNTKDIKLLQELFDKFNSNDITNNCIFFNGSYYDAYSKILDILKEAKEEIIIIDNYADKELLDIIRGIKTKVIVITKPNNLLKSKDIEKYNKQYHNLTIKYDNTFHDRYFILDNKILYHCGASINGIGYKTFSITRVSDIDIIDILLKKLRGV